MRIPKLLQIYHDKHLRPSKISFLNNSILDIAEAVNQQKVSLSEVFKDQYDKFKSLYGLRLNYTLVKNEEGKTICAKRIEKKEWHKIPPLEIFPNMKNVVVKEEEDIPVLIDSNDHSFIEEDMLSKSFVANNTS